MRIKSEDIKRIVKQIVQPLARGKFQSTTKNKAQLSELVPGHERSPEDVAPDNFQHASPFGFISAPAKGVLAYFLHFLGSQQMPVIINHIHVARPDPSGPGETILYGTSADGKTIMGTLTIRPDGSMRLEAPTKVEVVCEDADIIASVSAKIASPDVDILGETKLTLRSDTEVLVDGGPKVTIKSSGEVIIDCADIKLGKTAAEAIIKGTAFKAYFDTHNHQDLIFGIPNGVPIIPQPASTLSGVSKTE